MSITRRALAGSSVAALLVNRAGVSSAQVAPPASNDEIRSRYPRTYQSLVSYNAHSYARDSLARRSAYGGVGATPSIEGEALFLRNRIGGLATIADIQSKGPAVPLRPADMLAVERFIRGTQTAPQPDLVDRFSRKFEEVINDPSRIANGLSDLSGIGAAILANSNPYTAAALGVVSVVGRYVPDVTALYHSLRDTDSALVDSLVAAEVSRPDKSSERARDFTELFGIPIGMLSSELSAGLAPDLASHLAVATQRASAPPVDEEMHRQMASVTDRLVALQAGIDAQQSAAARQARAYYLDNEINGAISLGSVLIGEVGGDREAAARFNVIASQGYKATQLLQQFSAGEIGTLALTGGTVGAALAIANVLSGAPSSEQQMQQAMAAIISAVQTLRQEMHERFDRIERTQRDILNRLEDVLSLVASGRLEQLARLRTLREAIVGLRSYVESQDRQSVIDQFYLNRSNFLALAEAPSPSSSRLGTTVGVEHVNYLANYAARVAHQPAFTHGEATIWNTPIVNDLVHSASRHDLLINIRPIISDRVGTSRQIGSVANPVEWLRAAREFAEAAAYEKSALSPRSANALRAIYSEGRRTLEAVRGFTPQSATQPTADAFLEASEVVHALIDRYYVEFLRISNSRMVYAGPISDLDMTKLTRGPIRGYLPENVGFGYSEDQIWVAGLRPQIAQLALSEIDNFMAFDLNGQKNPLKLATDIGLLSFVETGVNSKAPHQSVRFGHYRFLHGPWSGSVVRGTVNRDIRNLAAKSTQAYIWTLDDILSVTPPPGSTWAAFTLTSEAFLQALKEQADVYHDELRRRFFDGMASFISERSSELEDLRAIAGYMRVSTAFAEWSRGADLTDAAGLLQAEGSTLTSPYSIGVRLFELATPPLADDAVPTKDELVAQYAQRMMGQEYDSIAKRYLDDGAAEGPVSVRLTLGHLEALAYHHSIDLP